MNELCTVQTTRQVAGSLIAAGSTSQPPQTVAGKAHAVKVVDGTAVLKTVCRKQYLRRDLNLSLAWLETSPIGRCPRCAATTGVDAA
jgi:hypothetical protein